MDATVPLTLGDFWGEVLGAAMVDAGNGDTKLEPPPGGQPSEVVWVNGVPEPKTGKNRVHLDLRLPAPDPSPLVAAGARIMREPVGDEQWWVLADPEGNEFCAFPPRAGDSSPAPHPRALARVYELVVDCHDARAQAEWWAMVTGGKAHMAEADPWAWVTDVPGFPWEAWVFTPVPESKIVKNRVHWDIELDAAVPDALLRAGATILAEPAESRRWWVMADREGNEFCAFPPREQQQ
ncbi:VOC family protein [Allostreptomyces psammosilenae]|uniref:Glyoxalase-like domain-containing protein n=1 Tax=Allostreptomyces psammosilenae TaxID=1892865 RepID=A0A853A529_9ACTN|nr:VOC family protein [Allostreptomyces psammosilenae]NYI05801.1 hypothetical protein [Allostreptomyces psammosilenae]